MKVARLRQIGVTAIALALATFMLMGVLSYMDWRRFDATSRTVFQSHRLLALVEKIQDGLRDAETGQRGFLLTGRETYLQPYSPAVLALSEDLAELIRLTSHDPVRQPQIAALKPLVDAKLAEMARTVELRRTEGLTKALTIVGNDSGKLLMDHFRELARTVEESEGENGRTSWLELQDWSKRFRIILLVGAILLTTLVALGVFALRRDAHKMRILAAEADESKVAAQQSRDLLQATLYSIGDGVITTDRNGSVRIMNTVAERLTGYKEAEASGLHIERVFQIVNGTTRARVESPVVRALQAGEVMELAVHTILIHWEGSEVPIDDSAAPISGMAGEQDGAVLVFRDVSERKKATEMARRLATIVEHSDDAIIGKSPDGTVTSWNRAAEKLFGYTQEELIGQPISLLIPAERLDDMTNILTRIGLGEPVERFETERVTKSGRRLIVSLTVSPIRDAEGHVIGASKIARDITHQRELESLMRQTQKMEAIGRLAGGVAHDFNNLLTVISGYAVMLQRRIAADDPLRWHVNEIAQAGAKAASLTSQLLTFSRKQVTKPTTIDLSSWIEESRDMLARLIGEDIELTVTHLGGRCDVKVDTGQLTQILMNLAVNARDAMPLGGKLVIETRSVEKQEGGLDRPQGAYVRLSVTDTGHGIDPEAAAQIFEPFFTTKAEGRGTGLGLSTVYGIVSRHRGWIVVQTAPGEGTTFQIYLPRVVEEQPAASESVTATQSRQGARILVVDDQPAIRRLASEILVEAGH